MSQTALVLGVTGMVGAAVARQLRADGWTVHGAARLRDPGAARSLAAAGITLHRFDVTADDPVDLPDVDVVFLEIWDPTAPAMIWPINFFGVGRVVERYAGATFVNGCTINVYGDSGDAPDEDTPCRPTSDYGRSRYAQERLIDYFCQTRGQSGAHVRYAHANTAERGVVRRFAESILAGESLGDDPDARIQVIGLEDFVRVTVGMVDRATCPPVAINCCHPRVWTKRELAAIIQSRLGRGRVVFDRDSGGRLRSAYADPGRMVHWFGEPTVPVDTVIGRVVEALNR